MKVKYLLGLILSAFFLVGCSDDNTLGTLGEINIEKTYLSIDAAGGSVSTNINSTVEWKLVESTIPAWLKVDNLSGAAGSSTITFSAEKVDGGREAVLQIAVGSKIQFITVRQGDMQAELATCAQVIAGPDGKNYRVKGVVANIQNTTYGNWDIVDETGSVYVYGTLDVKGAQKNFASLGIEVGDSIVIEGPKTTYSGKVELVNVTVLSIKKSLLKIASTDEGTIPAEGGNYNVKVAYKGSGAYVTIPEADRSWLSVVGNKYIAGVPTKVMPNPADTVVFTFHAAANAASPRISNVSFKSSNASGSSEQIATISQEGAGGTLETPFTVDEAIAFANKFTGTSPNEVYIKGIVSKIEKGGEFAAKYGNATFWISSDGVFHNDKMKDFEAYRVYTLNNKKWVEGDTQVAVGQEVILCCKVKVFNGTAENDKGYVYSFANYGDGTEANPYDAVAAIKKANAGSKDEVYIKGIISKVQNQFDAAHGTAAFWISADGTHKGDVSREFEGYKVKYFGNKPWVEGNTTLKVGDVVLFKGKLTMYKNTAETSEGYLIRLNDKTE